MGKHFENQVKSTPISENNETFATIHGYARCSTSDSKQDIDRQVRELKAAGATRIWLEYEHGDAAIKNQQGAMLEAANSGDSIIVSEVSRLPDQLSNCAPSSIASEISICVWSS